MTENEIKEKVLELEAQINEGEDVIFVDPREDVIRDYYYNSQANDATGEIDEDVIYGLRDFIKECEGLANDEICERFQAECTNWYYPFCEEGEDDEALQYSEDGLYALQEFIDDIKKAKNNEEGYFYIGVDNERNMYEKMIDFAKTRIKEYEDKNKNISDVDLQR